ncbi:cell filamentation protein Fic [Bifidobacterium sp. SMB2]|uniref:protein adenylyltransferase n=2 Tax=Bifidobacterium TaxID=1678 RepID=A0ABX0CD49_9BIFI|nr:cell filamentation protein Fic [Bifidobacterium sp. SMB2]NEH10824.1 cell filamentation protein Fic [Bifidobacterium saimiriisciurei]
MLPAERMSAVAFAATNCALESMTISPRTMRLARSYMDGRMPLDEFVDRTPSDGGDDLADCADAVFARTILFAERPASPSGDLAELRAIHHTLFEGIRVDAGMLRRRDTAQGAYNVRANDIAANTQAFFPAALLETGAANIASELHESRNLACLDRADFAERLAHFYDELGYLHPFAYGNAMVLRIFASRLAHSAGWDLDWHSVTGNDYRDAKRRAYTGDTSGFAHMFGSIVRPANPTRVFLISGWDQGPAH